MLAAAVLATPLAIGLLRPYQLRRLGSFLVGAHKADSGAGWAVRQARIALGSGGLWGRVDHPLHALLAQYLPERDTALALASLVEQWGLAAGGPRWCWCGGWPWPAGRPAPFRAD
jgi:cell division protein FtsW (lipid II flippase)